jgi:hypothetical protein
MFPFRMTSIEKYHFFDDSAEFPNHFFARFVFSGRLSRGVLEESYRLAVMRHIRGNAIARKKFGGRWVWAERDEPLTDIEFSESEELEFRRLDLRTEPGYLAKCFLTSDRAVVMMQVHHALTDGLGGLAFVRDWLVMYDNLVNGRAVDEGLRPLNPEMLLQRQRIGVWSWYYFKQLWRQPIALFGAAKFLMRRFETLANPPPLGTLPNLVPQTASLTVERETIQHLKRELARHKATLNDFLLATLYVALSKQELESSPKACWRVIVPISIRERSEQAMPTANRTTLVQLDRLSRETNDLWGLTRGIHFELGIIRGWMLDRIFLMAIRLMSVSNTWLAANARSRKPRATTLLTNLGKPFVRSGLPTSDGKIQVGDAQLESADLLPPVRDYLPISFSAMQYCGALKITAHVDTRVFDLASAQRLLDTWGRELRSVCEA